MINKNEIRLGNWYHHDENWSYHDKPGPFNFQWTAYDWVAFAECRLDLKNVFPIELTPEVLEEFGFRLASEAHWKCAYNKIERYDREYVQSIFGISESRNMKIECILDGTNRKAKRIGIKNFEYEGMGWDKALDLRYLHEFQNLYLDLTGEELKPGSLIAP